MKQCDSFVQVQCDYVLLLRIYVIEFKKMQNIVLNIHNLGSANVGLTI